MHPLARRVALALVAVAVGASGVVPGADVAVYTCLQVGALVALGRGVVTRRSEAHPAWWLVVAGVAAWVVADAWWLIENGVGTQIAWDSPAGALFALEYVFLLAAMAWFVRRAAPARDLDATLDVVAVLVAALFTAWALAIEPKLADVALPIGERISSSSYAAADAVLVALAARLLLVPGGRSRALWAMTAACLCMLVADIGYGVTVQTGDYETFVVVIGLFFMATAWLLAAAARHPSMADVGRPPAEAVVARVHPARMAMTVGSLVLPVPVAAVASVLRGSFRVGDYLVATSVLMVVAGARLTRLLTASERMRTEMARREAYYRAMAQNSSDGVLVVDGDGRLIEASPSARSIFGFERFVPGVDALAFVDEHDRARLASALVAAVDAPGEVYVSEARIRRSHDGDDWGWFEIRASNLLHDADVEGVVVNIHEVTARKEAENQLARQAFHDDLTGLANRALFQDRVEHALARRTRHPGDVVVLFCDLDGFKNVNDSLGHGVGDRLLHHVAGRVAAVVRDEDTVARLGGDEFAVLLEGADARRRADDVAARIIDSVAEPFAVEGAEVRAGTSIGIAAARAGTATADDVLRDADTAMYAAKTAGKGRAAWFEDSMRLAVLERVSLEGHLRQATARGELELRLQPIVALRTGRPTGFEALVRWRHPERGLLLPDVFLPLAEETGAVVDIGTWVLRAGCTAAAAWADDSLDLAVNVSGLELDDPDYPARVAEILRSTGLDPRRLVLEVTETTMVDDPDSVAARLASLKRLGVRVAIDDFGTGYSALQYLRRFPVDILKIDRSFVDGVGPGALPAIVRGLIELGRTLGLDLVAEGIERPAQLDGLAAGGCERGQGFLFAQPISVAEADELVRSSTSWPAASVSACPS